MTKGFQDEYRVSPSRRMRRPWAPAPFPDGRRAEAPMKPPSSSPPTQTEATLEVGLGIPSR
eukprot:139355-Pyramimonas_sp.AAC.1